MAICSRTRRVNAFVPDFDVGKIQVGAHVGECGDDFVGDRVPVVEHAMGLTQNAEPMTASALPSRSDAVQPRGPSGRIQDQRPGQG